MDAQVLELANKYQDNINASKKAIDTINEHILLVEYNTNNYTIEQKLSRNYYTKGITALQCNESTLKVSIDKEVVLKVLRHQLHVQENLLKRAELLLEKL